MREIMSISTLAHLDDCFQCGAARWEPRRDATGDPYLLCGGCGRTMRMPRQLQRRLPLHQFPRDAERIWRRNT